MPRHNPVELVTGALVLGVAGAFLAYAVTNTGRGIGGGGGYTLHASFDHVDGLAPGADVRIAGVKVGSVRNIALDTKDFLADVTFSVQNGVALSTDSSATVATDGLLGGKYVALETGGDTALLKDGGTITITQGSVNLEALIGKYIFGGTGGGSGKSATTPKEGAGAAGLAPLK